jgi:hypothetical protein
MANLAPVRVATCEGNITLSGPQTIDGIAVVAGDKVLVTQQSTGSQNGVYTCQAAGWTKDPDPAAGDRIRQLEGRHRNRQRRGPWIATSATSFLNPLRRSPRT